MYKIFLDKAKTFECDIKIEGASLNESEVRLNIEAENFTIALKGKINPNGEVRIPIAKLKGILEENYKGKISLEVIAEDTRFIPWESEYVTDISKKVEVKINEQLMESENIQEKPKIIFKMKEEKIDVSKQINEISDILKRNRISNKLLQNNKEVLNELIETYCKENHINEEKEIGEIKKQMLEIIG